MKAGAMLIVVLGFVLAGGFAAAQNEPAGLRFEAASIRPTAPGGPPISGTTISANRLRGTRVTLFGLIRSAFGEGLNSSEQFVGGPDWIRTEAWDINAVATITPTRTQFAEMTRNMLLDRFKVRVHREQREIPVFALLVAREDRRLGPQLTSVNVDCAAYKEAFERGRATPSPPPDLSKPMPPQTCDTLLSSRADGTYIAGRAVDMSVVARTLVAQVNAPVVNRTGLPGLYDFDLRFVSNPAALSSADGVGIETALREQLGLRLERQRSPMEVLVIDSAERPTPD
jgi:uncharacterized protein (TIGR03435 family)